MSQANPYMPVDPGMPFDPAVRKVSINPFTLLRRGYDLIGDEYWLFFGIVLVGVILGSAVPFGLLFGALLVGIYHCFIVRERGHSVEFSMLFKGFDDFGNSLIAMLILVGFSFLVIIPLVIIMFLVLLLPVLMSQQPGAEPPPAAIFLFLLMYPVIILGSVLAMVPFTFTFQLIADRNLRAMQAVKTSFQGVKRNFWGIVFYFFVITILSFILALMCYVPALLFMPITFASAFVLYRDVFPNTDAYTPVV